MMSFIRRYLPPPIIPYSVRIRCPIGVKGWTPPPEISRANPYPVPEVIDIPEGGDSDREIMQIHKGTQPYSV